MKISNRLFSRRELLEKSAATAAAAALASTVRGSYAATKFSTPGLYPGKVVGITSPGCVVDGVYQTTPIQGMMRRGMMSLTGAPTPGIAWSQLFHRGDTVLIKYDGNGSPKLESNPAVLNEIVLGLTLAGVMPTNIIIAERYLTSLNKSWMPATVRREAAAADYTEDQTALGFNPANNPRVTGYNPNYYVDCPGFRLNWQDPTNPTHTRSYVANFVTKATKIISLSILKDHQCGVTLGLKNLCQGMVNNVNRAHPDVNTNYLDQFVPTVVGQPLSATASCCRSSTAFTVFGTAGRADGTPSSSGRTRRSTSPPT